MATNFWLNEFNNLIHIIKHRYDVSLSIDESKVLSELKLKGWTTLDLGLSSDEIEKYKHEIDRLILSHKDHLWTDKQKADQRIFGAEIGGTSIHSFHEMQSIQNILDKYMGLRYSDKSTMAGRIYATENNLGSGGGWHRDTVEYKQVKSILYLSNVNSSNGPFQYIENSHKRSTYAEISSLTKKNWNTNRFDQEDIDAILTNPKFKISEIDGKAGTVILADTSGIHRGKPLLKGTRYALTNYIWHQRSIPQHIKKLIISNP